MMNAYHIEILSCPHRISEYAFPTQLLARGSHIQEVPTFARCPRYILDIMQGYHHYIQIAPLFEKGHIQKDTVTWLKYRYWARTGPAHAKGGCINEKEYFVSPKNHNTIYD